MFTATFLRARSTSTRFASRRSEHRRERRPGRVFRREDGPLAKGQAGGQAAGFGEGRLVGTGQHPVRRADVRHQSPARDRLPEHARAAVLLRGFAGWDPKYRIKVRVICSRPYHALFMHTMLIRPTPEELAGFGEPDFTISTRGISRQSAHHRHGFDDERRSQPRGRELIILGTEYAGEMKKGVFTVVNYFAPKRGHALDALLGDCGQGRPAGRRCSSGSAARARRRCRPIPSGSSSATTSTAGATRGSSTSKAAATRRRST